MKRLARTKQGLLGYCFLVVERARSNGDVLSNAGEIYEAAEIAMDIGCDYFEVKPMVDTQHNLIE